MNEQLTIDSIMTTTRFLNSQQVTQSQSKTPITRAVHCKFNSITVVLDRTEHGFYIIQNVHQNFIIQNPFQFLSVYKQYSETLYDAKQIHA